MYYNYTFWSNYHQTRLNYVKFVTIAPSLPYRPTPSILAFL